MPVHHSLPRAEQPPRYNSQDAPPAELANSPRPPALPPLSSPAASPASRGDGSPTSSAALMAHPLPTRTPSPATPEPRASVCRAEAVEEPPAPRRVGSLSGGGPLASKPPPARRSLRGRGSRTAHLCERKNAAAGAPADAAAMEPPAAHHPPARDGGVYHRPPARLPAGAQNATDGSVGKGTAAAQTGRADQRKPHGRCVPPSPHPTTPHPPQPTAAAKRLPSGHGEGQALRFHRLLPPRRRGDGARCPHRGAADAVRWPRSRGRAVAAAGAAAAVAAVQRRR